MNYSTATYKPLKPHSQKSYNGKAKVKTFTYGKTRFDILLSYDTAVAAVVTTTEKRVFRTWGGYTATTAKHLQSFHLLMGLKFGGKAEWEKLPVSAFSEMYEYGEKAAREAMATA